uniref:Thiamine biosynthesis protein S n=1 Tax=Licmophora sp. TaxID=2115823 RepID=A0A2U9NNN2_9STRA|nr:thiamine biosynthesis protein S [Licmophora sp.]
MNNIKNFFLNGQFYQTSMNITIEQILDYFNYQHEIFVIEYNDEITNKSNWKNITISNNDRIEIITIVGGG